MEIEIFKYKYDDLFNPALSAIHELGGSAAISEIEEYVAKYLQLSDDELNDIHRGNTTKLSYRLAWARTYLKRYGLIDNSTRGIWSLTSKGLKTKRVDKDEVNRYVINSIPRQMKTKVVSRYEEEREEEVLLDIDWKEEMLSMIQSISPDGFERLCQRMLREQGFVNVQVTGRTGDGGIDGKGIWRLGGILSFPIVFQCKRYRGNISPSVIRDFRGSMDGRTDKGVIFTTGNFSQDAIRESQRPGAIPIDLVDGYQLVTNLKNLGMGVEINQVEQINVKKDWFKNL